MTEFKNQLYYGDNLAIMRNMPNNYVDLIYLDPPFNSKKNYNIMYKTMTGRPVPEQVEAFCDTWTMDAEKEDIVRSMPYVLAKSGVDDMFIQFWKNWVEALRNTQPSLLAYLVYMTIRLIEMKRILKPTGSIYLHCDPTASHYIKVAMDGIFGYKNFRNEIIWQRMVGAKGSQHVPKKYGASSDTILFYSKSNHLYFNAFPRELTEDEKVQKFPLVDSNSKRYYNDSAHIFRNPSMGDRPNLCYEWKGFKNPHPSGWRLSKDRLEEEYSKGNIVIREDGKLERRKYLDDYEGVKLNNVWTDISIASGKERLGYPTQKPIALLDRIIKASCPKDGIVFDPFCGCGTTIASAHLNQRKWIGCDIAILSVRLIQEVLKERYSLLTDRDYITDGIPTSIEGAKMLFEKDPFQFQHWCVEYVGGFCNNKKTGDKGIDGRIYFDGEGKKLENMVISVKGGKTRPADVRDLRGTLEREQTAMAGLICLQKPTKAMQQEAESAGFYELHGTKYHRIQILTIKDMLEDKKTFYIPNKITHKEKSNQLKLYL